MLFYIKILLLALYLYLSNATFVDRIYSIGIQPGLVAFLGIWLVSIAGLVVIAFHRNTAWKYFWSILLTVLAVISRAHYDITSTYLSISEFELMVNLIGFTDNAINFYGGILFPAIYLLAIGLTGMLIPPFYQNSFINRKQLILLPALPIIFTTFIVYFRGGEGSNGLPDYSNIISFTAALTVDSLSHQKHPQRKHVTITSLKDRKIKNVVFIMDESIRGDFLDINNKDGVKMHLPPESSTNFGIASSASNCSTASNVSVRYGANKNTYMNDIRSNPSIWEYAKAAGYTTSYIDGQRTHGLLMNMMNTEELKFIDHFIQLDSGTKPDEKDMIIADKIRHILANKKNNFIYINKMGAHFPYEGKYPSSAKIASPTMVRTYFGNESDPKLDKSHIDVSNGNLPIINSYKNAINWNVSHFFDILLNHMDLSDTVIIYTSDHGQNFSTKGKHGLRTHCTINNAEKQEGMVPMFFLTSNRILHKELDSAAKINKSKVSHFNLYPSILLFLGYEKTDIKKSGHIEKNIFESLPDNNRKFISYFFTRFGKKPEWVSIDK